MGILDFFQADIEKMETRRDVKALKDVLNHKKDKYRKKAVEALRRIGDKSVVEALNQALKDGNWEVRKEAVEALGEIGDKGDCVAY